MLKSRGKSFLIIGFLLAGSLGCGKQVGVSQEISGEDFLNTEKKISYVLPVAGEAELMVEKEEKIEASKGEIRVATIGSPYTEILKEAEALLENKGYDLEIVLCDNYELPNEMVLRGEAEGNFFQHSSYLERYNLEKGTNLTETAMIYFQPMAIYPGKKSDIEKKEENCKILVPEGITSLARALFLLQQEGFLTLLEDADLLAEEGDIKENPYGVSLIKVKEEEIWSKREEADFIITNTAYAMAEGYHPQKSALAMENKDSLAAKAFGQGLVTIEENEEKLQPLTEVLCSKEMEEFLESNYKGSLQFDGRDLEKADNSKGEPEAVEESLEERKEGE